MRNRRKSLDEGHSFEYNMIVYVGQDYTTSIGLGRQHSKLGIQFSQAKIIRKVHKHHWTSRSSMMNMIMSTTVNKSQLTLIIVRILNGHSYRVQNHEIAEGHGKSKHSK